MMGELRERSRSQGLGHNKRKKRVLVVACGFNFY